MGTPVGYASCSYQFTQTLLSRPAYITFGIQTPGADPALIATQLANNFSVTGSLASIMDLQTTMSSCRVSLGTATGEDLVGVVGTSLAGTAALSSLPPNCAALIHKNTTRGGRRGRGRLFIPWCLAGIDVGENGVLVASKITTIQTAINVWSNAVNAGPGPLVVLHSVGKTSPGAPSLVTSLSVDRIVSTQRRRLGR